MIKSFAFFIVIFIITLSQAQTKFSGLVLDRKTNLALTGVNIYVNDLKIGTTTNQYGEFSFNIPKGEYIIDVTHLGYENLSKQIYVTEDSQQTKIYLSDVFNELEPVVVKGKSKARKIREQALPISVISMSQLKGTVTNVKDVLSKTTGIKLRNTGGEGSKSRISVRGLEGKRIGYYIDDKPMNANSDFLDLNDIPIDMIDRIEVYKGIVPAKLGGSAIGGAVNIIIKEYPDNFTDIAYTVASFNTHKVNSVYKRSSGNYEYGVGAFYTYSDNNYKMELPLSKGTFKTRDHDRFQKHTISGGVISKNNQWWFDEIEIETAYTKSAKEIQGIEYNITKAETFSEALFLSVKGERENFITDGLDFNFDIVYAHTIFKFQDNALKRFTWNGNPYGSISKFGGEIDNPSDSRNIKNSLIGRLNFNYVVNNWSSLNLNTVLNTVQGHPKDLLKDKALGRKTNFDSKMCSLIYGLNYEIHTPDKKFTNSFTGKYYQYSMNTQLSPVINIVDVKPKDIHNFKIDYGVSEALRYRFTDNFLVKTSLAYDIRLPSDDELLGNGFLIRPSINLIPERNTSVNVGLMYSTNTNNGLFSVEFNTFYMYLKDMIRFVGGPLQSNYTNFGKMETQGGEIELKCDVLPSMYFYANATYQDLRDVRNYEPSSTIPNATKGNRMPNIPYFYFNTGFELHKSNLFGGKAQNSRFFSDFSFVEEYFYDFEQSVFQKNSIPRAITVDTGIEHSFRNKSYIIGFQVNNLSDSKVISEFNRPLPGRNFALKLRYVLK